MRETMKGVTPVAATQEFLDDNQYSRKSILRYERIFGHTWVSSGGEKTTKELCKDLLTTRGLRVLDVGCGTGGSAFHMAEEYGASVLGVDLSNNMITIAQERLAAASASIQEKVKFEIVDITTASYEKESFDIIYTRDTVLHIPDKEALYAKLLVYLKPNGKLLVTDYCKGDQEHSQEFTDYVNGKGYDLRTVKNYGKLLEDCGYKNVKAVDNTKKFRELLVEELARFEPTKDKFIKEFSLDDYTMIVDGWRAKLVRCAAGDQVWGLFTATK